MKATFAVLKKFMNSKTVQDLGSASESWAALWTDSRAQVAFENKVWYYVFCIEKEIYIQQQQCWDVSRAYFLRSLLGNVRILDFFPGDRA